MIVGKPKSHSKICLKNILNHRSRRINFKDPEANTFESNWRPLKRLSQGSEKKYLADQCQYLYWREIRLDKIDQLERIFSDIGKIDR